ncbi:class I SAM-dependent DNA methyltransferase [Mucilaginibacter auburnensis]|uniref:Methyltransferase family protein n=1 Tax=Mucilaginibacter auburnensis TaxID=1457233 RepID=A0A2H9VRK7_9SPHI|nr:class I SAM-dependent methyltransferase [Mucilaginibacter auburnensis]PJJ83438.1 methyltransferase family protein [Mucilaginibacter auburnensis]
MEADEKQNVYKVYNKIAAWYDQNRSGELYEKPYLDKMLSHMPPAPTVLDLGCGTGKPIIEYFISRDIQIVGVDASSELLNIARTNFPDTDFYEQDMRLLKLNRKFDGIIAWNSFFHLPAADQPAMFGIFEQHLNPGGILMFTSGTEQGEAWGVNGGENMYHASLDTAEYEQLLSNHNFDVIHHKVNDPDCGGLTVWMAKLVK